MGVKALRAQAGMLGLGSVTRLGECGYSQIPLGRQSPGPPGSPAIVGQQAKPSSQGASVPEMHSHPAERQAPKPHNPSCRQKPEQQPTQFSPRAQVGGQTTPSPLQRPPKHWLGGTQVPEPPGRSGSSAQQTRPGVQEFNTPVRQRQSSSAQGRICAPASRLSSPIAASATVAAPRANRPRALRRDCREASRFARSSNRFFSIREYLRSRNRATRMSRRHSRARDAACVQAHVP
jgi:hypothetical protein